MTLLQGAVIVASAAVAGMINAVAGGGTLLSFPAMIWVGLPPITANATNTVALVPGAFSGAWGYRRELRRNPARYYWLLIPSFVGGLAGSILLRLTPPATFARLVPLLILFATVLFMLNEPVNRWLRRGQESHEFEAHQGARWMAIAVTLQLITGLYGGYFGAGIGIMMLATLGLIGLTDIYQMNGLKNLLGSAINLTAALYFIYAGLVDWPVALIGAAGALVGGYGGAGLARQVGPRVARRAVIVIGFAMAISLLFK